MTAATKLALVHGDVSPKNILISRSDGHPVFLDAECAWFGDPAFDAAFCMNHLFLKAVHVPFIRRNLIDAAQDFLIAWGAGIPHSESNDTCARAVRLLPCLMLARIDGKSPVEYLDQGGRQAVRAIARDLIARPSATLAEFAGRFEAAFPQDTK